MDTTMKLLSLSFSLSLSLSLCLSLSLSLSISSLPDTLWSGYDMTFVVLGRLPIGCVRSRDCSAPSSTNQRTSTANSHYLKCPFFLGPRYHEAVYRYLCDACCRLSQRPCLSNRQRQNGTPWNSVQRDLISPHLSSTTRRNSRVLSTVKLFLSIPALQLIKKLINTPRERDYTELWNWQLGEERAIPRHSDPTHTYPHGLSDRELHMYSIT
eukprot:sb/3470173/